MKQRPIDLLPQGIRARTQAGVVAGWYVAAILIGVVLTGLMVTHSRLVRDLARQRLRGAQQQADLALSTEAKAEQLRLHLEETRKFIDSYDVIALPLDHSRIVATIVNALPRSATLERITLESSARRAAAPPRLKGAKSEPAPGRVLIGELSGFAASNGDLLAIVKALQAVKVFEQVNLDYSRTRLVRDHVAREFRISLRADLDARYHVAGPPAAPVLAEGDDVE
jgi:Tfp pilus assembly protein PilN